MAQIDSVSRGLNNLRRTRPAVERTGQLKIVGLNMDRAAIGADGRTAPQHQHTAAISVLVGNDVDSTAIGADPPDVCEADGPVC